MSKRVEWGEHSPSAFPAWEWVDFIVGVCVTIHPKERVEIYSAVKLIEEGWKAVWSISFTTSLLWPVRENGEMSGEASGWFLIKLHKLCPTLIKHNVSCQSAASHVGLSRAIVSRQWKHLSNHVCSHQLFIPCWHNAAFTITLFSLSPFCVTSRHIETWESARNEETDQSDLLLLMQNNARVNSRESE